MCVGILSFWLCPRHYVWQQPRSSITTNRKSRIKSKSEKPAQVNVNIARQYSRGNLPFLFFSSPVCIHFTQMLSSRIQVAFTAWSKKNLPLEGATGFALSAKLAFDMTCRAQYDTQYLCIMQMVFPRRKKPRRELVWILDKQGVSILHFSQTRGWKALPHGDCHLILVSEHARFQGCCWRPIQYKHSNNQNRFSEARCHRHA